MDKLIRFLAASQDRVDLLISRRGELSRSEVGRLVKEGAVKIAGRVASKAGEVVKVGEEVEVSFKEQGGGLEGDPTKVEVIYEDSHLAVINKESGLVVHPGSGVRGNTLVNRLIYHFDSLSEGGGGLRPGLVHRLDKDTSGLLLVAKNNQSHAYLAEQLKSRVIEREYLAIAIGRLRAKRAIIRLPIGRHPSDRRRFIVGGSGKREAETTVYTLREFNYQGQQLSLVRCRLGSGRTHQIRVHLAAINLPIYGDPTYSRPVDGLGQRLHAYKLRFKDLEGVWREFKVGVPRDKFAPFLGLIEEELGEA